ncbi:MAG: hypothetical protein JJ899_10100 [Alphaproteobacteria bacterium]|nr:hypothetical protein [Alphaproteobacteria bacterium]
MPVHYLTDDRAQLLAYRFSAAISCAEVVDAIVETAAEAKRGVSYCFLLVFDPSTDLTPLEDEDMDRIAATMNSAQDKTGFARGTGAVVVDDTLEAETVKPLWKAICDSDTHAQMHYRFFIDIGPALAWLDVAESDDLMTLLD